MDSNSIIRFNDMAGQTVAQYLICEDGQYWGGLSNQLPPISDPMWSIFMGTHYWIPLDTMLGILSTIAVVYSKTGGWIVESGYTRLIIAPVMSVADIAKVLHCNEERVRAHFSEVIKLT